MSAVTTLLQPRLVFLAIFLFCVAALGIALYMQHAMMLEPCALCIMQRVWFLATALVALAAAIHNPQVKGRKLYGFVAAATSVIGSGFAIQQIHLQHLPADKIPTCMPSLGYMLEANFPMKKVLEVMFMGDGNCAEITWRDPLFNFFTIPDLSLIAFAMLIATALWQALRKV